MREAVGSAAFHQRYGELMAMQPLRASAVMDPKPKPSTLRWLCYQFYDTPEFRRLNPRTQHTRRLVLEACFREPIFPGAKETFADFPLDRLTTNVLEILRDRKAEYPEAANARVKALRRVFAFAVMKRYMASNVARDVAYVRRQSAGWRAWEPDELLRFEQYHAVGTKARLALDLLQFTGASRSDVVVLGPQNIRGTKICFKRTKTSVQVELPITEALRHTLDTSPVIGATMFTHWP